MNVNIIQKACDLIKSKDTAVFSALDEKGYPSCSAVSPIKSDGIFTIYFATGLKSNKVICLKNSEKSSLCYFNENNVTLVGKSEIITDQQIKDQLWEDWFIDFFTGKSDPNYCIIKFTTERVLLWIDNESAQGDISDILTHKSRCGLICNSCSFNKLHECGGCIETNGHPFYGECPIAVCCQAKGYDHCGQCSKMPCEQLRQYSCGDSEHCDNPKGARLNLLNIWASETNNLH